MFMLLTKGLEIETPESFPPAQTRSRVRGLGDQVEGQSSIWVSREVSGG